MQVYLFFCTESPASTESVLLSYLTQEHFAFLSWVHFTDETQVVQVKSSVGGQHIVKFSTSKRFSCERKILELLQGETHIIAIQRILLSPQQGLYGFVFMQYSLKPFTPKNNQERVTYMYQVLKV